LTVFLDAPQRPLTREHLLQATRVHKDVFDRTCGACATPLLARVRRTSSAPSARLGTVLTWNEPARVPAEPGLKRIASSRARRSRWWANLNCGLRPSMAWSAEV
jgi:hypothetical protein